MNRVSLIVLFVFVAAAESPLAVPPLVSGNVPTADRRLFEWYAGVRYQESESGPVSRQLPFTELVYGISDRQEITFEIPYLSERGERGFGDGVVGTKFMFIKERERIPGIALSFELKLPSGDESSGLGTGELNMIYGFVPKKVPPMQWQTLRVDFNGSKFTGSLNGKNVLEWIDTTFSDPGKIGLWTKADSVTLFDDFSFGDK